MNKALTAVISAAAVIAAGAGLVAYQNSVSDKSAVPAVAEQSEEYFVSSQAEERPSLTQAGEILTQVSQTVAEASTTKAQNVFQKAAQKAKEAVKSKDEQSTRQEAQSTAVTEPESTAQTTAKPTETEKQTEQTTAKKDVQTSSGTLDKDMDIVSLYRQGYDVYGTKKYIYNNDKDCAQSKFGYNRFYDKAAPLADFHIVTVRIPFKNYGGKDWMVQMWKGTYITGDIGTVGCEIGLYNRKANTYGGVYDHYNCAPESDWLNMEMSLLWDDEYNGNYKAQFTRTYGKYWWPTGFVDGQLKNVKDTSCLRVLGRITFKDSEMAEKFDAAIAAAGFTKVANFDPGVKDTYKRQVCDVIFCWQDAR